MLNKPIKVKNTIKIRFFQKKGQFGFVMSNDWIFKNPKIVITEQRERHFIFMEGFSPKCHFCLYPKRICSHRDLNPSLGLERAVSLTGLDDRSTF